MPRNSRQTARHSRQLVLSCEHGGNRIPRKYAHLFRGAARTVNSHRGWDPGALDLARYLGQFFHLPVHAVTWCRLLVESNRAPTNYRIWSQFTTRLPAVDKKEILERYWWPHRREVEADIENFLARGTNVVHVAVHSFVPVLDVSPRNADIGLLYDSSHPWEKTICRRWQSALETMAPALRVRRNYPYPGATDGLCTWLRRRHPTNRYVGVELEVNQVLLTGKSRAAIHRFIARSLDVVLRG